MIPAKGFIQMDIIRFHGQFSPSGHGVTGVGRKVEENLLDVRRIKLYLPEVFFRIKTQMNVLTDNPGKGFLYA